MKKLIALLASLILLVGCSSEDSFQAKVPESCESSQILESFPDKIPNPKFIDTQWEPAEGTDLFATYQEGGIACSYGIQEAEIGATILWASNKNGIFEQRSDEWISSGMKEIDLPNIDEAKAYVLTEGIEGQGEYHVWKINLLINEIWIQVNGTFFGSVEEAMPIVKAAVASTTPNSL